jgi:hypothetical protein
MKDSRGWKAIIALMLIIVLTFTVLFLKVPFYYQARSYVVMYAFSKYEEKKSLLNTQNIAVEMPGGLSTKEKDWYPLVMVFNDHQGFSRYMNRDLSLTVLYNFGAFSWNKSSSAYFQEESPYYNSFYGGYLVKDNSGDQIYGFNAEGKPDIKEVFAVPEYDYKYLVLESMGCPKDKLTMEILSYDLQENVSYAGFNDWDQLDALLLVNSPDHKLKENRRAYIQFGNPLKPEDKEDFQLMTTHGRVYLRYFPEFESTIFLYILAPQLLTLEKCDAEILSKTVIAKRAKLEDR